ncbi:MAG: O-antigen ligase family protein, partial [Clostridia bacterium]|nr:O-antigen ligase family protein [Clostridia bacterium]
LLISLVYYFVSKRAWYYKVLNFVIVAALITLLAYYLLEPITQLITSRLDGGLASVDEARWKLLLRSISDFKEHPLFGIGFCSTENADIYAADGCISWYHLYFPQIWGSLGLVGCVAFLYQLAIRARLAIFRPNATTVALALSYLGILLYSQTDPGEFVPIPFAALAVLIFVYLEKHYENEKGRTTWFFKRSDLIKKEKSLP